MSVPMAVVATGAAAVGGLVTTSAADALGYRFPSLGFSAFEATWKLWTAAVLVAGVWITDRRWVRVADAGLTSTSTDAERAARTRVALLACAAALALSFIIPGWVGDSSADAGAYDIAEDPPLIVVAVELLLRYPLTVVVEESFFRGWLFRLVPAAPVTTGILFGLFHLQQWTMIPSLAAFGVALGMLRWWTGDIRLSCVVHYLGNAMFFLSAAS